MEPTNNAIVQVDQAQLGFVSAIGDLAESIMSKARAKVYADLGPEVANFGELEISAMEAVEALRLTGALDLAGILIRFKILKKIRDENLLSIHPGRYEGLTQMASEQSISVSELHDILMLGDVVFPFLEREYGPTAVADYWDEVGKARLRELVPSLNSAITGVPSQSRRVREAVENAADLAANTANSAAASDHSLPGWIEMDNDERRRRTAIEIVEMGRQARTIRELRATLQGEHTPPILFMSYGEGEAADVASDIIFARVNSDQCRLLAILMHNHIDFEALERGATVGGAPVQQSLLPVQDILTRANGEWSEHSGIQNGGYDVGNA
jgi:hypothetical protein